MKNLMTNCIMTVAALAVTGGSASAQVLKADIPFTFRAGKTLMAPGTYEVKLDISNTRSFFMLRNTEARTSVLLANFNQGDVTPDWKAKGLPTLGFECVNAHCVLRELWTGVDSSSYYFRGPKLGRNGDTHMTAITMTPAKAD